MSILENKYISEHTLSGKGNIVGIIFGTISFTLIVKIITALGMNALLIDSVKGLILLVAVGLQMIRKCYK